MARIDAAYNYLMTTYGKTMGSRYDTHKKSELRSLYHNILKTNKESPLYKISQSADTKKFVIDIKANAHQIQSVISALDADDKDISSMLKKRIATSSDSEALSVHYVGSDDDEDQTGFDMEILSLATPQVNQGNYLDRNASDFEEGTFSFDLDMPSNSYEFQFNVNPGDNNYDIQRKIARLVNQADIGLTAEVLMNDEGKSALSIQSRQTGLAKDQNSIFTIQSGSSFNEIRTLGISQISSPAANSAFLLNGKEHSSLSNTFTINRAFEVTMHKPTKESAVHIGFKANTAALNEGINNLLASYNGLWDVGEKYASTHGSRRLLNEISSISRSFQEDLEKTGITFDDAGHLKLDKEVLAEAIGSPDSKTHFNTLNHFKHALSKAADRISIDPVRYINKVIVEYKNPGKTLAAPYAPSVYAGMLIDQAL